MHNKIYNILATLLTLSAFSLPVLSANELGPAFICSDNITGDESVASVTKFISDEAARIGIAKDLGRHLLLAQIRKAPDQLGKDLKRTKPISVDFAITTTQFLGLRRTTTKFPFEHHKPNEFMPACQMFSWIAEGLKKMVGSKMPNLLDKGTPDQIGAFLVGEIIYTIWQGTTADAMKALFTSKEFAPFIAKGFNLLAKIDNSRQYKFLFDPKSNKLTVTASYKAYVMTMEEMTVYREENKKLPKHNTTASFINQTVFDLKKAEVKFIREAVIGKIHISLSSQII